MRELKLGKYRHFKGYEKIYEVLGEGTNTETNEDMVIYRALYKSDKFEEGKIWIRPKKMFLEKVPKEKVNPTGQEYRFEYIDED